MAQEYDVSARDTWELVKADLVMKRFKYRKIHLLTRPQGSRGRQDQSYCSNGTHTTK
ncbi:Hypothetical protein FKW44_014476 [Caligus rogercresseyi]|uniref:Uncharacterized protein n=1 Tax=Caligus rogercresseyi TaxID=217165 RepID=A0A7T8GZ06_CALRO|nr:Hypothetical protein FKW44_014476 [Caligus rogercresseyi]